MIIPLKCTTGKDLSIAIETMKIPLETERGNQSMFQEISMLGILEGLKTMLLLLRVIKIDIRLRDQIRVAKI